MASKTFKKVQGEVMRFARKNGLSEPDAIAMLRRELRKEGISMPESMATDAQYENQRQEFEKGDPVSKKNAAAAKTAKDAMKNGGMAYGKKHMYVAGGDVKMNPGLKALKASSPEAFNKITQS